MRACPVCSDTWIDASQPKCRNCASRVDAAQCRDSRHLLDRMHARWLASDEYRNTEPLRADASRLNAAKASAASTQKARAARDERRRCVQALEAQGLTVAEIAATLGVCAKTIRTDMQALTQAVC
jgi:DNA-binding NarL/FixJ family response regulator